MHITLPSIGDFTQRILGRMFLFAGYEQVDANPFGKIFFPISNYLTAESEDETWMGLAASDRSFLMSELAKQGDKPA
jgi:hypothetical protein